MSVRLRPGAPSLPGVGRRSRLAPIGAVRDRMFNPCARAVIATGAKRAAGGVPSGRAPAATLNSGSSRRSPAPRGGDRHGRQCRAAPRGRGAPTQADVQMLSASKQPAFLLNRYAWVSMNILMGLKMRAESCLPQALKVHRCLRAVRTRIGKGHPEVGQIGRHAVSGVLLVGKVTHVSGDRVAAAIARPIG